MTDRKVAGVCGGLGRHLDIDPTLVRVLFVVLVFFGGAGLLLYGALWLLVPQDGKETGELHTVPATRRILVLGALVVTALIVLGNSWGNVWFPWPIALLALVVMAFVAGHESRLDRQAARVHGDSGHHEPSPDGEQAFSTPDVAGPDHPSAPVRSEEPPRPRGLALFVPTLALVAIALGLLGLYDANGGTVADGAYGALALAVVGVMAMVAAFYGRGLGLGFLGLVAGAAMIAGSALGGLQHTGELRFTPTDAAAVHGQYDLDAGQLTLDLRGVRDLAALDGRTVRIDGAVGEVLVLLPPGLDLDVTARVRGAGDITIDGRQTDGWNPVLATTILGGSGVPRARLDIVLNFGQIQVNRSVT